MRLRWLMVVVAMGLSLFGVRAFQLQGLDPKAYAAQAEAAGAVTAVLPARRGEIVDRKGGALAESVDGDMLVADPAQTKDHAAQIARILADDIDVDYFDTLTRLEKPKSRFQYLQRRVPSTVATAVVKKLNKAGLAGVYTKPDPLRTYPAKDVAANLVGVQAQGRDDKGKITGGAGLESAFDHLLSGKDGKETYEVGDGNRIPLGDNSTVKPVDGKDLKLTIDRDLQWYVQRVLRNAVESSRSDSGSAVVMDTKTGQVLSLADYPTFDPNDTSTADKSDLGSRALQDVYEPGSVSKVLTLSSLLDEGRLTPETKLVVPPQLDIGDRTIHDWFDHPAIHLTTTGVIARSSNIGTALASRQLSDEDMWQHLRSFGLGTRTEVGMPGETRGLLPDWHGWQPINHATIAFGQGVSVNTLQMASAVNTIANGGTYVSPSLIEGSATTDSGETVGTDHTTSHRVISAKAASQMAQMMEMVPNPETGTAPGAQVNGYRVSGKTGTAQRVGADGKGYDGTFTVSFAGFAPADKPRFTVYVVVQNPRNGGGGGSIGGPAFSKIQTYLLQRYGVAPTGTKSAALPIDW
ncbi:peptidoglycan D,D-transpeptidase FtsI family protein [Marmoricola endophyticus]|uniref:peptidoglycan D,D-transpeptidase FtsI family protein n=1 Tax=Marmoricola endophyticus TaxID=2040280 RepID=UPI001E632238|nr:penicillin-binding protein 2 [Marmoricola endophyticus]